MVVSTVPETRERGPITIRAMCHLCRSVQSVGTNERIVKVVVPLASLATADLLTNILYCSFPCPRKQGGCYLTIYCSHRTMLHIVFTKCLVMYYFESIWGPSYYRQESARLMTYSTENDTR